MATRHPTEFMRGTMPDGLSFTWIPMAPWLIGDAELIASVQVNLFKHSLKGGIMVTPSGPLVAAEESVQLAAYAAANDLSWYTIVWENAPDIFFGIPYGAFDGPSESPEDEEPVPAELAGINDARMVLGQDPLTADGWNPVKQWRAPQGGEGGGRFIDMPDIKARLRARARAKARRRDRSGTPNPMPNPMPSPMPREAQKKKPRPQPPKKVATPPPPKAPVPVTPSSTRSATRGDQWIEDAKKARAELPADPADWGKDPQTARHDIEMGAPVLGTRRAKPGPIMEKDRRNLTKFGDVIETELDLRIRETWATLMPDVDIDEFIDNFAKADIEAERALEAMIDRSNRVEAPIVIAHNKQHIGRKDLQFEGRFDLYSAASSGPPTERKRTAQKLIRKIEQINPPTTDLEDAKKVVEDLLPQRDAYFIFQRDIALEMMQEMGNDMGGSQLFHYVSTVDPDNPPPPSRPLVELLKNMPIAIAEAAQYIPTRWHDAINRSRPHSIPVSVGSRGWYVKNQELVLREEANPLGDQTAMTRTALHESTHAIQDVFEHMRYIEWAMSHFRSPRDKETVTNIGDKNPEWSFRDRFGQPYSGRVYSMDEGYRPAEGDNGTEMLTTGIESLFTGSNFFFRDKSQAYLQSLDLSSFDNELRSFILALLAYA